MNDHDHLDPHATPRDPHVDVAAYLLGALDGDAMDQFERHLATCAVCSARLDELSGVVPVLAEVKATGVPRPPGDGMLDRLLGSVAAERRAKQRRRVLVGVAASVLIVAGPTAAVLGTQASGPPPYVQTQPGAQYSATDPSSGAHATLRLTGQKWGTHVDLTLTSVYGPNTCRLVAVGRSGRQETVANWTVPTSGYGTEYQPAPLTVQGSTAMSPSDIARFDVIASTGQHLVSVPV
ncbi:zf-HC2 domain-containing protein [Streptomyces sp. RB6PN25]|uniref:Zf-HC2 domain-containing protein n=1 Tax=Streptomyces humicola TaxID=2953240 RepID=A0ABT1Q7B5_9ACTN|nr:anti-sigma factor [Streptomyces humicola]MCQ4084695.1 zf-HC2 domain-containing protein [Streptomyces humicola]